MTKFEEMRERQLSGLRKFAFGDHHGKVDLPEVQADPMGQGSEVETDLPFLQPEIISVKAA